MTLSLDDNEFLDLVINKKYDDFTYKNIKIKYINRGAKGIVYKVNDIIPYAIKKISATSQHKHNALRDINHLKYTNVLLKKTCPNYVKMYSYRFYNGFLFYTMELADGTFDDIMYDPSFNVNMWISFLMQIMYGMLAIQRKLSGYHGDLKSRNILFKKVDKNKCFEYVINKKKYCVPTFGYKILIADFDIMQSKYTQKINVISLEEILQNIKNNTDFIKILTWHKRIGVHNILQKYDNVNELINIIPKNKKHKFDKYYKKIKKEIPNNRFRNEKILQGVSYFLIENNMVEPHVSPDISMIFTDIVSQLVGQPIETVMDMLYKKYTMCIKNNKCDKYKIFF